MTTETIPDHILRPHMRPIQPIPVMKDGKQLIALRDPTMLVKQSLVIPMPAMRAAQLFRGDRSLEEISGQIGVDVKQCEALARQMDKFGLLWGPTFEGMEKQVKENLHKRGAFPARASQSLGQSADECREAIDQFFADTEDPELDFAPTGVVAPHLDYQRGWPNYAGAYFPWREAETPDRVVVLGTNHFGLGDGVVQATMPFETPLGTSPTDSVVIDKLTDTLGDALTIDQLDHLPEHSVELQLPWIQYCFGDVPVVAALLPDPIKPMIEDDDKRVSFDRYVETLRNVLSEVGGTTYFVASSDLSHVGPQFGEPRQVDENRREEVERHDREMLGKFLDGDPEGFLSAMKWNKNPTRWCSIGNMAATLLLAEPKTLELVDYRQAYDEKGTVMVSSAAICFQS